jgi:hypothetical protein
MMLYGHILYFAGAAIISQLSEVLPIWMVKIFK